jgi:hypothetical protein
MASRAGAHVERAAALGGRGIDPMRAARRLQVAEPGGNTFDGGVIDGLRRDAGAERGRKIALGERGIVAVPVQMHAFARPLIED